MRSIKMFLMFIALATASPSFATLEAHEWGTFTSLVGSDGITQNGMTHEDEPLPAFVHGFGQVQPPPFATPQPPPFATPQPPPDSQVPGRPCHSKLCFGRDFFQSKVVTQKMETPVIYFYSDSANTQYVDVNVRFPEGVITETYPAPEVSHGDLTTLANGSATFKVGIQPGKSAEVPAVDSGNIYGHARAVNSNIVTAGQEKEKFIFYRGLGRFQPRLRITSHAGDVELVGDRQALPLAAFLVHVDANGEGRMLKLGSFVAGQPKIYSAKTLSYLMDHSGQAVDSEVLTGATAHESLVQALVGAGLKTDEAQAMVNTWERGYLRVPGLRLLYILPRNEIDQTLPVDFTPAVNKFVRVFVGRIEILRDTDEEQILQAILKTKDQFDVASLGRFAEPILRRVSEVYSLRVDATPENVQLFGRLIQRSAQGLDNSATSAAAH